jgi:hypothetical protein
VRRTGSGPGTRYLLQLLLRVTRGDDGHEASSSRGAKAKSGGDFLSFIEEMLPERKEPMPVRLCAELCFDAAGKRPVFNLPVQLMSETEKGRRLRGAHLTGIELRFEGDDNPFDHLRIAVTRPPEQVWVRFGARDKFALGDDPVGAAYTRARRLANLFLEEVKAG